MNNHAWSINKHRKPLDKKMYGLPYTLEEDKKILEKYGKVHSHFLAQEMGRTVKAIKIRYRNLKNGTAKIMKKV